MTRLLGPSMRERCLPFGLAAAIVATFALATFALAAAASAAQVAKVGRAAPSFLEETPAGDELSSRTFAGHPLVLNVFASWCPPCRGELPLIASAARAARGRITFVGIDEQEPSAIASRFARDMHLPFAIALDGGQFAASYGAISLPETIFVDRHGIVRAIQHGALDARVLQRDLALVGLSKAKLP